jgi:hypothetical protein
VLAGRSRSQPVRSARKFLGEPAFLGRDKLGAAAITRADIASFLLDQLEDTRFIRAGVRYSSLTLEKEFQCRQKRTPASSRLRMRLSVGATWRRLPR